MHNQGYPNDKKKSHPLQLGTTANNQLMYSTSFSAESQHGKRSSRQGVIVFLFRNGSQEVTSDLVNKDNNVWYPSPSTSQDLQFNVEEGLEDLNQVLS